MTNCSFQSDPRNLVSEKETAEFDDDRNTLFQGDSSRKIVFRLAVFLISVQLIVIATDLWDHAVLPSSRAIQEMIRSGSSNKQEKDGTQELQSFITGQILKKEKSRITLDEPNAVLFEDFVSMYKKIYASREEYNRRELIFYDNIAAMLDHNAQDDSQWKMGINPFSDLLEHEIPKGLHKSALRHHQPKATQPKSDDASERDALLASLPASIDWRTKGVTTPIKNQGHCGSCWAFASTAALESHLAIRTGKIMELSVQELVTCVPNPDHCGGTGGCDGSTAELAYAFVSSGRGILTEWEWGYTSGTNHVVPPCSLAPSHGDRRAPQIPGAVASIQGFSNLRRNSYYDLLAAVATQGPVVVNIAANGWHLYKSGIFDDSQLVSPPAERDINHVVVVEGYGTEAVTNDKTGEEQNLDYWLVRNSWGPLWGEDGYIRLKREVNAATDDCLPDSTPSDGIACVGPDNSTVPPKVEVCGTSGILYDGVYPTGGHLLNHPLEEVDAETN